MYYLRTDTGVLVAEIPNIVFFKIVDSLDVEVTQTGKKYVVTEDFSITTNTGTMTECKTYFWKGFYLKKSEK